MDRFVNDRDDAVVALLRRTFEADVADIDAQATTPLAVPSLRAARAPKAPASRAWLAAAAAAVAAVGAGSLLLIGRERGDSPASSTSVAAPTTAVPTTVAPADEVAWFVPRTVPAGYELVGMSAAANPEVDMVDADAVTTQSWFVTADDGLTIVERITVTAFPVTDGVDPIGAEDNTTVHGLPAFAHVPGGEQSGGSVAWVEAGMFVQASSNASSIDVVKSIAESSTVAADATVTVDESTLPAGASRAPVADRFDNGGYVTVYAGLMPIDGSSGAISVVSSPAGGTLDATVEAETERRIVGDREYSIVVGDVSDGEDPHTSITWVDGGRTYSLLARTDVDVAMAVATGVEPVTADVASTVVAQIDAVTASLPTVSAATLPSGMTVTTHASRDGDAGIVALCVESTVLTCARSTSEQAFSGETGEDRMFEVFDIDGERLVVGWMPSEPSAIELVPSMVVGLESDSAVLATIVPEVARADSGEGHFVTFVVPDGEPIPGIEFNDGSGVTAMPSDAIRP